MRRALRSYGLLAARRPRLLLAGWLVLLVATLGTWAWAGTVTDDTVSIPGSDADAAQRLQQEEFPRSALGSGTVLFAGDEGVLAGQEARTAVEESLAAVREVDGVTEVVSPYPAQPGAPAPRLSEDGSTAYAQVSFDVTATELTEETAEAVLTAAAPARAAGLDVLPGGQLATAAAGEPGHTSEIIGIAVAAVVLLLALGALTPAVLPLLTAVLGLLLGLAVVGLLSHVAAIPSTAVTVATMISLGVGIDYALFLVVRYRTLRRDGMAHADALGATVATSGAAVVFAGATVAVGLGGMLLAGLPLLVALGWTSAVTVGCAVLAAVGVLPAVLGLLGDRIETARLPWGQERVPGRGGWYRTGHRIARRPWLTVTLALAAMAVVVAPVAGMTLGQQDDGNDPVGTETRESYDLLEEAFGAGTNGPLLVVADLDGTTVPLDQAQAQALTQELAAAPGVASVQGPQVSDSGRAALWQVVPETSPSDPATGELVTLLRDDVLPGLAPEGAEIHVGGQTAAKIDFTDRVAERLPLVVAVVIAVSFLLLVVLFRSVVIPLTAALMNLLSVAAAFGILTFVFAEGNLVGLVGLDGPVPIESFVPLMLFAILFGLSMDYEVFLVSSIAERWHATNDPTDAVVSGLGSAGRVVTAAALIMFSVFLSFAGQDDPVIKMFGVGLALAVLLDAVVVRGFLVPGLMVLLGRSSWWLPGWLGRALPTIDLESVPVPDGAPACDDDKEKAHA